MGFLGKFIITIVMLGMFSFVYISLNEAYEPLKVFADAQITDADSVNTVSLIDIQWTWIPIAVLFSYVVWSIEKPRKEKAVAFP